MSSPEKRLLICEEALKNYNGHWFEYNRAVFELNRAEGVDVEVLAHRDVDEEIAGKINAVPFFECTNWDGIYFHATAWRRYLGILQHNFRIWRSLSRFFNNENTEKYDCVFVPTVVIFHLIAWLFLAKKFGGKKFDRVVLLIRNSATTYDSETLQFSRSAKILGFVLRRFRSLIEAGVVEFATDSHRLADEYRQLAEVDLTVLPHPCCLTREESSENRDVNHSESSDAKVTFISPGPARWEKGVQLLLEAAGKIHTDENVVCRIQWPDAVVAPDGSELKPEAPHCEFLRAPLSSADYEAFLQSATCIVLPYLREAYYARISGVAVEAMLLGIPVIYTKDTWIADMIANHGAGLGFVSGDSNQLADCIIKIAASPGAWRQQAEGKIESARSYFSARNFQERLWGNSDRSH